MFKRYLIVIVVVIALFSGQGQSLAVSSGMAVIDAQSGRLLFGTNPHAKLPIASLTKIWTAFVVIENSNLQDKVVISKQAATSEGSSIYLKAGETTTVETLLYGLMLRSGNDAAYALAEHVGGSIEGFVQLMNDASSLYGLRHTTFSNPSGLHHENHLSSAYDTAKMLQIALKNKDFYRIATALYYESDVSNGVQWMNKHKLLHQVEEAKAGKTGYTKVAGRTLATYFEKDGASCIVVTLNEGNDWQVHRDAANRVWDKYDYMNVAKKGKYQITSELHVQLKKPIRVLVSADERTTFRHVLHLPRVRNKQSEGIWSVFINNERVYTTAVPIHETK